MTIDGCKAQKVIIKDDYMVKMSAYIKLVHLYKLSLINLNRYLLLKIFIYFNSLKLKIS